MTADWKKPPLQRGKRYSDIQRLQARVKELEDALEVNHTRHTVDKELLAQLRKVAKERLDQSNNYRALRRTGVMLEHEGEFKFLEGDDLDKFLATHVAQPFGTLSEVKMEGAPAGTRMILPRTMVNEARALLEKSMSETLIYNTANRYNIDYGSNS